MAMVDLVLDAMAEERLPRIVDAPAAELAPVVVQRAAGVTPLGAALLRAWARGEDPDLDGLRARLAEPLALTEAGADLALQAWVCRPFGT